MQTVFFNISQALATAIIHCLWQALLIYTVLRLVYLCVANATSATRYKLSLSALVGITVWFAITLFSELYHSNWDLAATTNGNAPMQGTFSIQFAQHRLLQAYQSYTISYQPYLPYISLIYGTGLLVQFSRLIIGKKKLAQLKQSLVSDSGLDQQIIRLAQTLQIKKPLLAGLSRLTHTPCVTGYLKPIIFLPVSAFTSLSADEIEALLIHELAHIKRNDYLINLFQQVVLTILFFNPLVWLINRSVNEERENCCDDIVVQHTNQPLLYARALVKLQETQAEQMPLVLAATGKNYHLLNRIERIMETKKTIINPRHIVLTLALMAISLGSIAWLEPKVEAGRISVKKVKLANLVNKLFQDTVPPVPPLPPAPPAPPKFAKPAIPAIPAKPSKPVKLNEIAYDHNFKDPEFDKLVAEVDKHAKAIEKFYSSAEFEKLQADLSQSALAIENYYNSPEMKHALEEQEKQAGEIEKIYNNPDVKELQAKLTSAADKVGKYYSSPAFGKLQNQYEQELKQLNKYLDHKSTDYKQRKARLDKLNAEIKAYTANTSVQANQQELAQLSKQLADYYKQSSVSIKINADSVKAKSAKLQNDPAVQAEQRKLTTLQTKLKSFQQNPQLVKEHALLQKATQQLQKYQNSPAFKKRWVEAHKLAMTNGQFMIEMPLEKTEHIELTEKSYQIEIKEKPEPKEAPEQKEPRL